MPREVAEVGFNAMAVRNRIAHTSGAGETSGALAWEDLIATLAACHKILDWLSRQDQLLYEFCQVACVNESSPTMLASTPSDDWLNYRVRHVERHEIPQIVRIDRSVYDPQDIVSEEAVLSWWDTDPECLTCIEWAGDKLSGYFCMLFLKPRVLDSLIAGELQEKQLRGKDPFRCSAIGTPKDAYISSIVVQNRFSPLTPLLIQHMANRFEWLHRTGILRKVYACAATANGERLVRRFKFDLVKEADANADHHPLYVLDMSSRPLI